MSLFDCESDDFSGSAASDGEPPAKATPAMSMTHAGRDGRVTPGSTVAGAAAGTQSTGQGLLGSRFTITEADVKKAELRWRQEALASASGGCNAGSPAGAGNIQLAASIAEALQLKREDREAVLLARIRKQLAAESADEELASRDREVGVFVTPAYRQMLEERQRQHAAQGSAPHGADGGGASLTAAGPTAGPIAGAGSEVEEDDDDVCAGPLDAFIQSLAAGQQTAAGPGGACAAPPPSNPAAPKPSAAMPPATAPEVEPRPTPTEGSTEGGAPSTPSGRPVPTGALKTHSELLQEKTDAARAVREARKKCRVEVAVLHQAAARFEQRALQRLS